MSRAAALLSIAITISVVGASDPPAHPRVSVTIRLDPQHASSELPLDGQLIVRELNDKEPRQSFPIGTGEIAISGTIGSLWRVELAARDWWMDPATVTIPASPITIALPIYRAATLSGRLAGVASEKLPQSLKIVVEAPPWAPRALANGVEFHCSVGPAGAWTCPVPATPLDVAIIATGYVPEYRWNVNAEPGSTRDAGTIRLREGGSATAWVSPVRDSQRGAEGVRAMLKRVMPPASSPQTQRLAAPVAEAAVAANGFVQLAPIPPGRYMLEVSAEGFATSRIFPLEIFEDRETTLRRPIELNRPVSVAIHLNPPVEPTGSRWRATVHYGSSFGAGFEPSPVFEGAVAESGVIEMTGQSPGRFRIRVADAAGNRIAEDQFEASTAGSAPFTIDIPVVRVRGSTFEGSSPLPATLWFGGEQGMPRVRMTSDESGEFSGWLPRTGRWVVDVRSTDGRISTATKVSVAESEIVEIVIPKTRVSGTVTDVKGPAANARVVMGGGGVLLRTVTDDKGLFSFTGVSPGSYTVTASSREGEVSAPVAVQLQNDDSATEHLRLTLKSPGLVAGRVLGKGRPLVGARVEVAASGGGLGTVTDVDGSFSVKVAAHADRASFIVRAAGHALTVFERPLDNDEVVLEIDDVAGTIEFPLGDEVTGLRLFQNGTFLPIPLALGWAQSQGVVIRQHALVAVPNVATGAYRLCHRAEDATERCADGTLLPGATLRLSVTR